MSKQPTDTPEGYVQVTGGNYGLFQTEGAVGGPLTDEGRHAGVVLDVARTTATSPTRIGTSINNQKQYAGRLQFKIQGLRRRRDSDQAARAQQRQRDRGQLFVGRRHPDSTGRGVFAPPGTPDLGGYMNTSTSPFNQAEDRRGILQPHGVGRQRARQLEIRGLLARFGHGLLSAAEALQRGLGHFAESDIQLRHRRALPAVLPGIPPERQRWVRCAGSRAPTTSTTRPPTSSRPRCRTTSAGARFPTATASRSRT